jgi:ketosteroid isomerase-like protein
MSESEKSNSIVKEFMRRLQTAEAEGDPKHLVEIFADDAKLTSLTRPKPHHKNHHEEDDAWTAQKFWSQYLFAFERIGSHFTHVTDDGRTASLEWSSKGALANGMPIEYCGVTVIEYEDGKIHGLRTYYDSAALLPHASRMGKEFSDSVGVPEITTQATS